MFLADLLILLVFVWVCRKIFQRFHLPALFGEVFAGVIAGPLILGVVAETEAIKVLAELGIFFLMFHSGLESNPRDLFKASKLAILVAIGGGLLSMAGGFLLAWGFGYAIDVAFFLGMTLSVTAVAILARLLKDVKMVGTKVANTAMAAAVMLEVFILVVFSIFLDLGETGTFDFEHVAVDLLKFAAYFGVVFYVGHCYFKYLYKVVYKGNKGFTFSLILALTLAVGAELIGLHFIIGAFLAGLFLHQEIFEAEVYKKIEDRVFGISYSFLAPIFFATLAFHLDFTALYSIPVFMVLLVLVAIFGKVAGSALPAYFGGMSKTEALGVGVAMNSRGALDLIIASIALGAGIIDAGIFSVLVLVSFAATLVTILCLKPIAERLRKGRG